MIDLKRLAVAVGLTLAAVALALAGTSGKVPPPLAAACVGVATMVGTYLESWLRGSPQPRPPAPPAPPSTPTLLGVLIAVSLLGCLPAKDVHAIETVILDGEQLACVITKDALGMNDPQAIVDACNIPPSLIQAVIDQLNAQHKAAAMVKAARAQDAGDGG